MQKIHDTKIYKKYHQFFRFCIVGVTNFLIGSIVYYFVLWIFSCFPDGYHSSNQIVMTLFRYDYQIANVLAFVVSVLNAYVLNRIWVFKKEAKTTSRGVSVDQHGSRNGKCTQETCTACNRRANIRYESSVPLRSGDLKSFKVTKGQGLTF